MKHSFKLKLIFSYICVILVSLGGIAFFLDRTLEDNSLRNLTSSLVTEARLIERQIPLEELKNGDITSLEALAKELSSRTQARITVISIQGKVLADSGKEPGEIPQMENHSDRPEVRTALAGETGIDTRYSATLKIAMLYVALPLKQDGTVAGILRLALPEESVQRTLFEVRKAVFLGLFFALSFAFVFGSVIAAAVLRPINRMIQVSMKYSKGDFSSRILPGPDDEIGKLAQTLNAMAQEIEDKITEIKTQNQEFSAIFNSMADGVIAVDKDTRILSVNPTIETIFGISRSAVGKLFLEAVPNNDLYEIVIAALRDSRPFSQELALVWPVQKIFKVNATPILGPSSSRGCLLVIHDITEMRRLETVRSDFVANVSHELKTPLTSIKGFVETLLEGALEDKENSRAFLRIIQDHAERLNNLVNDLLELSHLESRQISLAKEGFDLRLLTGEVLSGFRSQLKKRNLTAENNVEAVTMNTDKNRISQVLTNLIDNAIKYTTERTAITIYSETTPGMIKITVKDEGPGIPVKDLPRLFERFYRVDKARSREMGGTGLGLSIVKHIVELHGGSVGVESVEAAGSQFWFTLPIK
jgi:two-component system, OmpR family, phosphate regulon sensor histidine kinase PhoR